MSDARLPVHDALVRSSALPLPLLCDAALCASALRLRSAFPHAACAAKESSSFAYPAIDAPYCSLQPDDELSLFVRSLEDNYLDEQAKQALQNVWRGNPFHLKL